MRMPVSWVKRSMSASITLPSAPVRPFQYVIVALGCPTTGRPEATAAVAAAPARNVRRFIEPPRATRAVAMAGTLKAVGEVYQTTAVHDVDSANDPHRHRSAAPHRHRGPADLRPVRRAPRPLHLRRPLRGRLSPG